MDDRTWQDVLDEARGATATTRLNEVTDPNVPDVGLPLGSVTTYRTVSITEVTPAPVESAELTAPLDLLGPAAGRRATEPAVGVVLDIEQAWRMKGLALGRLVHSLSLAPGEVTQVAMVDWDRSSGGTTSSDVSEQEATDRAVDRSRDTVEVTRAVADQVTGGGSSASSFSAHTAVGVGGLAGFLGASGGASADMSVAFGCNWNTGSRSASAASLDQVRQATSQQVSNVRSRTATLVQEVSQSESERFTSRVVANYNHMHALNVQYFEVLQVYELAARPVRADRCIFLPMEVLQFDPANVVSYAVPLARAAVAMGRTALAAAIQTHVAANSSVVAKLAALDDEIGMVRYSRAEAEQAARESRDAGQARAAEEEASHQVQIDALAAQRVSLQAQLDSVRSELARIGPPVIAFPSWVATQLDPNAAVRDQLRARENDLAAALGMVEGERQTRRMAMQAATDAAGRIAAGRDRQFQDQLAGFSQRINDLEMQRNAIRIGQGAETDALLRELNEDGLAFNQALWLQLDPATIATMIGGYTHGDEAIANTLDPRPIVIEGNYVGYRWGFPDTEAGRAAGAVFEARYLAEHPAPAVDTRVVPTTGLFAEATLGLANAGEKLDLTRFWHWDQDTIPILPTAIEQLQSRTRAARAEARADQLGTPSVAATALPDLPGGPSHALASVIASSMFRDMSGGASIRKLLETGQAQAAKGTSNAMQLAHENISAVLDHVEQLLPDVLGALSDGTLDPSTLGSLANALSPGGPAAALGSGGTAEAAGEEAVKPAGDEAVKAVGKGAAKGGALDLGSLASTAAELGLLL